MNYLSFILFGFAITLFSCASFFYTNSGMSYIGFLDSSNETIFNSKEIEENFSLEEIEENLKRTYKFDYDYTINIELIPRTKPYIKAKVSNDIKKQAFKEKWPEKKPEINT